MTWKKRRSLAGAAAGALLGKPGKQARLSRQSRKAILRLAKLVRRICGQIASDRIP